MPSPFVWFDNIGNHRPETTEFLKNVFGWASSDIASMTFLTAEGEDMPFAATTDSMEGVAGWVPYLEVEDLEVATKSAQKHGAQIIAENLNGPAGKASFIRDPGGAPLALWKRATSQ